MMLGFVSSHLMALPFHRLPAGRIKMPCSVELGEPVSPAARPHRVPGLLAPPLPRPPTKRSAMRNRLNILTLPRLLQMLEQ